MNWLQFNPLAIITAFSALFSAWLSLVAFRRRQMAGGLQLALLLAGTTTWNFFYTLELLSRPQILQVLFSKLAYFGILVTPVAWYLFGFVYNARLPRMSTRAQILLWCIPALTFFMVLTNEQHGLFWKDHLLYYHGKIIISRPIYGPYFWVHAGYSYLLLLGGTVHILQYARSSFSQNRQRAIVLTIGLIPAWIVNLIYLLGREPVAGFDLTPIGLFLSGMLLTWGLYRYNVLAIIPVAAETVLETIEDGILLIRARDHVILHVNKSIYRLLAIPKNTPLLGKSLEEALPQLPALLSSSGIEQVNGHWLQTRMRFVQGNTDVLLIYLQDVTAVAVTQQELEKRNHFLDALNHLTNTILAENDRQHILNELARQSRDLLLVDHAILLDTTPNEFTIISSTLPEESTRKNLQLLPLTTLNTTKVEIVYQSGCELQTLVIVPLLAQKIRMGTLVLGYYTQQHFDDRLQANAVQVAGQIALGFSKLWLLDELQKQAIQDDLTQTYNHRFLNLSGQKIFQEAQKSGCPFSVIFFDLDNFKSINDQYGHLIGDLVLSQIARRVRQNLAENFHLVRYGGDEFVILMPNAGLKQAQELAQELLALQEIPIPTPKGDIYAGISIGIATRTADIPNLESLLRNADHALYRSKELGKGMIFVYEPGSNTP